jgi:hypothetical protein
MADNVPITAGSGTTVATDEVNTGSGSAHVQLMKLLDGTDGGTERIQGTAAFGLEVDVTRQSGVKVDDAAFTAATDSVTVVGGIVTADSVDSGDAGAFAMLANRQQKVTLYDSGGVELAVGGGTQYTEGDTDASITGTAALWEDSSDTLRAVSMAKPLPVQPGTSIAFPVTDNGGSLTVDGSVTVTQGTAANLNCTEASAATIATNTGNAATSLAVIDDWDESDRAKVNPIVGQAGVAAGAGAVGATVQRVTLASDDPAVTALQIIDDWDESDRAKVNIIVGQAGITAGAGAVAANTPRVTHASDDPVTTALQIMDDWDNGASDGASVSGDVAHDAGDAGEPVKLGHKAIDLGANPTDVAANDRTNWYAMRNGVPFVIGGAPFVKSQNLQVTDADGAQTDTAIITVAANNAIMVTAIEVTADNANTGDVSVRIGFGTANTPAADADKVILFHPGIAPGSGLVKGSGAGIIGAGLSNEDLRVTCEDPAGGSVSITVTYFTLAIG